MIEVAEFLGLVFLVIGLLKYLSTDKMMIMVMSLELSSVFLYSLFSLFSEVKGGVLVGLYSVFLVMVVMEGVVVLVLLVSIYRKGSKMSLSLSGFK